MSPRKAVIVGPFLLLGIGVALAAYSGPLLYHWHVTGELWVFSKFRGSYYATYSSLPFPVLYDLLMYGIIFAFGALSIAMGLYIVMRYWPRLMQRSRPPAD